MAKKDKLTKIFEAYLAQRKILVADTNSASRSGLARTLVNLGAKTANVFMAPNFDQALSDVENKQPHVVVCDYDLGTGCGLDLLQNQRQQRPESKDCLFILVTGNTSQSTVAQAAEEDVDTFILKPYTIEVFRQTIMKAAIAKIYPSPYNKKVDEGKTLLFQGKTAEAKKIFDEAIPMDKAPTLAYFYKGQADLIEKVLENAQGSYQKGLTFNKIHYKCLVGLYELLMDQKKFQEAYETVKRVSRYFPANPKRLTQVLRLAVMTQKYEDIERYYQAFTSIDQRNDELVRYVCAALVVCGKFYLSQKVNSRALELFKKAGMTAGGRIKILREIVTALCEADLVKECPEFMKRFPADTHKSADYLAMDLLVADKQSTAPLIVEKGRKILDEDIHDPTIYEIMVRRSAEAGLMSAADDLLQSGAKKFPKTQKRLEEAKEIGQKSSKKSA